MTTTMVVHQQRLITRARVRAAAVTDAEDLTAHGSRVSQNLRLHGSGQGLADGMRADNAAATREEAWQRPGLRTFFWSGLLGAAFAVAVEQAPHAAQWSWVPILAAFVVTGALVSLARYSVSAAQGRAGLGHRATAAAASSTIGCGDPDCPLEPCATYLSVPIGASDPVDLDAELRALQNEAHTDPGDIASAGRAEIVHRPAPACPDCIATAWLDHRQPPGMVGLITVHEPSCPYYAKAIASSDQLV
jgi:hypothetical protein